MKKVEAIIRPFRLGELKVRLREIGVSGLTIDDLEESSGVGAAHQAKGRSRSGTRRGAPAHAGKVRLEIVVKNAMVREVVGAIIAGSKRALGGGQIFVNAVDEAIRIRTNERGTDAISI